jgi:hypothetical protein
MKMSSILSPFRNTYRYLVRLSTFKPRCRLVTLSYYCFGFAITATSGARVPSALLLRRPGCDRPRARIHGAAHP